MTLFEKITTLLDEKSVSYDVLEHEPVHTSEEAAAIRGMSLEQGAKAMLFFADGKPVLIVLSGALRVDTKSLKKEFDIKDLRFATPEEVEDITTVKIGAVPPFGSCFGVQTYCDVSLSQNAVISFNPGEHAKSITMAYEDYIAAEAPIIIDCSKE